MFPLASRKGRARRPGVPCKLLNQRGSPGHRALPVIRELPHRYSHREASLFFYDPDIAEVVRVSMCLEIEGSFWDFRQLPSVAGTS